MCGQVFSQSQKVNAILFDTITSTERDAYTIEGSRVWFLYNETTGQFEVNPKNSGWVSLSSLIEIPESQISDFGSYAELGGTNTFTQVNTFSGGTVLSGSNTFSGNVLYSANTPLSLNPSTATNPGAIAYNFPSSQISGGFYSTDGWGTSWFNNDGTFNLSHTISATNRTVGLDFSAITGKQVFEFPATGGTIALTSDLGGDVPDDTGSSDGDVLTTDGAGTYTWETPSGGGGGLSESDIDTYSELNTIVSDQTLGTTSSAQTLTNKTIDADNNTISNIGAAEIDLTDDYDWTGSHEYQSGLYISAGNPIFGDSRFYMGEDEGVSGRRWHLEKSQATDKFSFSYQQSDQTTATGGTYTALYTLDESGVPTSATDLIDKAYGDANYAGGIESDTTGLGSTAYKPIANFIIHDVSVDDTEPTLGTNEYAIQINGPVAKSFSGTTIPFDDYYQHDDSSTDTATWTLGSSPKNGATVEILINLASEPAPFSSDTGVTQISGTTDFASSTLQLLTIKVIAGTIYYYYTTL